MPLRISMLPCSLAATLAAVALAGCQAAFEGPPNASLDSLLHPVTTSPNSVKLEIFHVRIPPKQEAAADALWNEVDEQCIDADLRGSLVVNGMRAGVVGGTLPAELTKLLDMQSKAVDESDSQVITAASATPQVTRRVVQVNRRDPISLLASELRDEAQVMTSDEGRISGRTYRQVEAAYSLRAEAVAGQRVALRLVPELNHGEMRERYSGSPAQGIFLKTPSREHEVFDSLGMDVTLSPGEVLVLGGLPNSGGSLGNVFYSSESAGRRQRKLILVRLVETPRSEILAKK